MGVDQSVELAAQPGYWPKGTLQLLPPWLQSATGGRDLYLSNARADLREKKVSSSLPALLPIFFFFWFVTVHSFVVCTSQNTDGTSEAVGD